MDNSRDRDLQALHSRYTDSNLSQGKRKAAHTRFERVQSKLRDRELTALRYRLIGAIKAENAGEADKIEQLIKEQDRQSTRRNPSRRSH